MQSLVAAALALGAPPPPAAVAPSFATAAVPHDADDPAIWVHPTRPERSLILGNDKEAGRGGLYVFDLRGRLVQRISPLDRPNNVDVEGNLAVATERLRRRLKFWAIDPATGTLRDATGDAAVLEGLPGEQGAPMGVAFYRRPSDRALFVIVSPKEGPREGYLWQYRVVWNPVSRAYDLRFARRFGAFSGGGEIEAIAVDHQLGYVYYSDEGAATRKYFADPDRLDAGRELAAFNTQGWSGDREGIALWTRPDGTGYLICTDQIDGNSVYHVYRREGNNAPLGRFTLGADETDGIEVTSAGLGPAFPRGLFVAMNSQDRNFLVADWRAVARSLDLDD